MHKKNLNTSKTDIELIEENITDSIVNNIKIDFPEEDDFPMPQTAVQVYKDRIIEETEYLQTGSTMRSKDFETMQTTEDEAKSQLIKPITPPLEGQIVNDKMTIRDYTRDDNKIGKPINVRPDVNNIVEDIINNTIQANNDQSTVFIEPEIKEIEPKIEQKITFNEIITDQLPQNGVEIKINLNRKINLKQKNKNNYDDDDNIKLKILIFIL